MFLRSAFALVGSGATVFVATAGRGVGRYVDVRVPETTTATLSSSEVNIVCSPDLGFDHLILGPPSSPADVVRRTRSVPSSAIEKISTSPLVLGRKDMK